MATKAASLKNFFIFNTAFGTKEDNEHEKLFMFYPSTTSFDEKMNAVGITEALFKFSSTFNPLQPCEALHTLKTRQLFLNPEENFFMSMGLDLPSRQRPDKPTQYYEDNLHDSILMSTLKQAYRMFTFFNGSFTARLADLGKDDLAVLMDSFFSKYLSTINWSSLDVMTSVNGIQFLPLDKTTYLKIQCFVNVIEAKFPVIKYTVFLYNDHLVWSGLEQDDMRVLYRYLTGGLLKNTSVAAHEFSPSSSREATPGFLLGSTADGKRCVSAPKVFLRNTATEMLHLVVYQHGNVTICFFVDPSVVERTEFFMEVEKCIGPQIHKLNTAAAEQYARKVSGADIQYKYVYFNHMNLATKSSFLAVTGKADVASNISTQSPQLASDPTMHIADLQAEVARSSSDLEIFMKAEQDIWIFGRKSDQREFFVVLTDKSKSLAEVYDEVRRLSLRHFTNIFFID